MRSSPAFIVLSLAVGCVVAQASPPEGNDWPTVQGNAARHGWSDVTPEPPYRLAWRWTHGRVFTSEQPNPSQAPTRARLNRTVQPIVHDGRVYFGALNGEVYCLVLATGRLQWSARTQGPILHAAATDGERVYVSSADGAVHALDARTGQSRWRYQTPAAFMAAPLLVEKTLYIGGRDGVFRALEAATGQEKWTHPVAVPILNTAASDGESVFFIAEDSVARALDLDSGQVRWTYDLGLGSARHYWPVVAGDWVFVRAMPLDVVSEHCQAGQLIDQNLDKPWSQIQPQVVQCLEEHPGEQTLVILGRKTGRKSVTAAVGLMNRHGDVPAPPIVAPDGRVFVWARTTESSMRRSGFGSKGTHEVCILDPVTGLIEAPMPENARREQLRNCTDDYNFLTGGGPYIGGLHTRPIVLMPIVETPDRRAFSFQGQWDGAMVDFDGQRKPIPPGQGADAVVYGHDNNLGRGYSGLVILEDYVLANVPGPRGGVYCWKEAK